MTNIPYETKQNGSSLERKFYFYFEVSEALADPGRAPLAHTPPPQQDPFLSFSHMFLLKSVCVRDWCPHNRLVSPPQRETLDLPLHI